MVIRFKNINKTMRISIALMVVMVIFASFILKANADYTLEYFNDKKIFEMNFNNKSLYNSVKNKTYSSDNGKQTYPEGIYYSGVKFNWDRIVIPVSDVEGLSTTTTVTASFWLRWDGTDNSFMPLSFGLYDIYFIDGKFGFNTGNSDVYGVSNKIPANKFVHVIAEFNTSNIANNKLYINGQRQSLSYVAGTSSLAGNMSSFSNFAISGWTADTNYKLTNSILDEITLYKGSVTDAEAKSMFGLSRIPEISAVVNGANAKVYWATEILESDVLWKSGFEDGDSIPNFNRVPYGVGGQSVTTEQAFSGSKSVKLTDTIKNGNHFNFPYTSPVTSLMVFARQYLPNGSDISLSFKVKGSGRIGFIGDGGWADKFLDNNNLVVAQDAPAGATTIKLKDVSGIVVNRYVTTAKTASQVDSANQAYVASLDTSTKTITLSRGTVVALKAGDLIHIPEWVNAFTFGSRDVASNNWTLHNINTQVTSHPNYNVLIKGGDFLALTDTNETIYLDDVKIGYATQAQLYRDGTQVYKGYLSEFNDTSATDKAQPTAPGNISVSGDSSKITVSFTASSDKGTTYKYRIKGVTSNGETPLSKEASVEIKSGIKGYSYLVDTSASTVPDNTIETTSNSFTSTISGSGTYYVHIKAIDNAGNSTVVHRKVQIPDISATANNAGNSVNLSWTMDTSFQGYNYKIYRKKDSDTSYQAVDTTNTSLEDKNSKDTVAPGNPSIKDYAHINNYSQVQINLNSVSDNGSKYNFYLEAKGKNNSEVLKSTTKSATVVTGVKGYSYVVDTNASTEPDNTVDVSGDKITITRPGSKTSYLHIKTIDGAGNASSTVHYKLEDVKLPVAQSSISPTAWTNGSVTITVSATDESGIKSIKLPSGSEVTTSTATYSVSANGNYAFQISDNYGNVATKTVSVTNIDKSAPTVSVSKTPSSNTKDSVTINLTATDVGSGVNRIVKPDSTAVNGSTASYTVSGNGSYVFEIFDNVGNKTTETVTVSNIDKTAPVLTLTASTTAWTNGNVTITAGATDNLAGVALIELPNGTVVSGNSTTYVVSASGTYTFKSTDSVGNVSSKSITISNIDKTNPSVTLTADITSWTKNNVTITFDSTDSQSGIKQVKNPNGTIVTVAKGSYTVSANGSYAFEIIDNSGNVTTKSITVSNIDKTAPGLTLSQSPTGLTSGNVTVTATGSDSGSGVKRILLPNGSWVNTSGSTTFTVTANGTFSFTAEDTAGNQTAKTITVSNIDKTPPSVSTTQNPTAYTNGDVTISLTSTDNLSGVKQVKLPSGNVINGSSASYTVSSNGNYTFEVTDNTGNVATKVVAITNIDKSTPTITISKSTDGWTNGSITLTAVVVDDVSGVREIKLPNGNVVPGARATYTVSALGVYYFEAVDNVGNKSIKYIVVDNIDTKKPDVKIQNNAEWNKNSSVPVTIEGMDN